MKKSDARYQGYLNVLRGELVPALGCTEPIALAFAAAKATAVLGVRPERMAVSCSGNVVKNVKGVKVPGAGDLKGIQTASILGALGGDSEKGLQVLMSITQAHLEETRTLLGSDFCTVDILEGVENLHILTTVFGGGHSAMVEISKEHTNIIRVQKDDQVLQSVGQTGDVPAAVPRPVLSFDAVLDFADSVEIEDVQDLLELQIRCNSQIAEEGLTHSYGANVGKSLLHLYGDQVWIRARAKAAAGSDARMSGCVLPVVINSGSGNQGLTVSLPVIEYAREYGKSRDELLRALVVSNLMAIHQKTTIGKLSAYCGAVSAACASGVAIAYLMGESRAVMAGTLVNTLGNVAGIVCDGAKASCAAKISSSVEAAITGYRMAAEQNCFEPGDGLITEQIDDTILNYGRLAKVGMAETDKTILRMMIDQC